MTDTPDKPEYANSRSKAKIDDLFRLLRLDLTETTYVDGRSASQLLASYLEAYRQSLGSSEWTTDTYLRRSIEDGNRLNFVLASAFDLVTNMEYFHDRIVNSKWIYCHRADSTRARVYYSFLKQCPKCCIDKGLELRLTGAQHKPKSHHIGEITTTLSAMMLRILTAADDNPLTIGSIAKQSHDVDLIGYRSDILVLFEVKASPMVTYPLCMELDEPMYTESEQGDQEYAQHSLVDVTIDYTKMQMFVPHRDWLIPLGAAKSQSWPYPEAIKLFSRTDYFLKYMSSWLELFYAYSIPKRDRTIQEDVRTYLVNGWGDQIDSNKTKPGLGRTDDIKKGTYQMLKFGAYYRDDDCDLKVCTGLVANLDSLFLHEEYVSKLLEIRWGVSEHFEKDYEDNYLIRKEYLHYLYESIIAFNRPIINDPTLRNYFDFQATDNALITGKLDNLLADMKS